MEQERPEGQGPEAGQTVPEPGGAAAPEQEEVKKETGETAGDGAPPAEPSAGQ